MPRSVQIYFVNGFNTYRPVVTCSLSLEEPEIKRVKYCEKNVAREIMWRKRERRLERRMLEAEHV